MIVRPAPTITIESASERSASTRDVEIAGMNERFRKMTGPTDVLSFPTEKRRGVLAGRRKRVYTEGAEKNRGKRKSLTTQTYLGDVAISPETARRYAKKNGRSLNSELRVLILHGVLHLLGYDHETDHGEMDRIEVAMRQRFGLS